MDKITLSIHDLNLKEQIKEYAKQKGISVSNIVETYLKNLIKASVMDEPTNNNLPKELDLLLDGIEISENVKNKSYKTLRDEMYETRAK